MSCSAAVSADCTQTHADCCAELRLGREIGSTGSNGVPYELDKKTYIDFIDNGKGIKKTFFKEIFEPGFTSKKRGWGLGLSLVKRIIKDYHQGSVQLVKSIPNKETVIRIILTK